MIGWRPRDLGWWSSFLQFLGTLLFNINTWDAMRVTGGWWPQDLAVWSPNLMGSLLFFISGYAAFCEVCPAYWAWKPRDISWLAVAINVLGCWAFLISALLAFVRPATEQPLDVSASLLFTAVGGGCFLALLMVRETRGTSPDVTPPIPVAPG